MLSTDKTKLQAAMRIYSETQIEVFRHAIDYADIPLQTYALFLFLPMKGSISMSQVVKLFNTLSQASVSRNVDLLCGTSRLRLNGGYQLAERFEDIHDRRAKLVQLSPHGKLLRESMHEKSMQRFNQLMGDHNA